MVTVLKVTMWGKDVAAISWDKDKEFAMQIWNKCSGE